MVELLLFGLVMRLFGMRREREKWHVAVLLFFLFVAAMATSLHPLILLYLLIGFVLWLLLLVRFLQLHLEATYPLVVPDSRLRPQRLLATFAVLTLVVAVPFFTLLPRLRTPYIMGQGGSRQTGYSTGFRDEVNLDVVGSIRENPAVALRMKPEDATVRPPHAAARHHLRSVPRQLVAALAIAAGDPAADEASQPLPPGARRRRREDQDLPRADRHAVAHPAARGGVGRAVAAAVPGRRRRRPHARSRGPGLLEYRVGVASRPVYRADVPRLDDPARADARSRRHHAANRGSRQEAGVGASTRERRRARFERYLGDNMAYSLDFLGRDADNPIEDFLFRYKSGHCEYFATAMILMLRSVGIPARLATGFLGAEFNPLEDYYIVRQSNAHAWVEAYFPETGWTTIDPTPPSGRPAVETRPTMTLMLRQTWDYLEFRWDRYVMAYGFFDQVGYLLEFREFMRRLARGGGAHGGDARPRTRQARCRASRARATSTRRPWCSPWWRCSPRRCLRWRGARAPRCRWRPAPIARCARRRLAATPRSAPPPAPSRWPGGSSTTLPPRSPPAAE